MSRCEDMIRRENLETFRKIFELKVEKIKQGNPFYFRIELENNFFTLICIRNIEDPLNIMGGEVFMIDTINGGKINFSGKLGLQKAAEFSAKSVCQHKDQFNAHIIYRWQGREGFPLSNPDKYFDQYSNIMIECVTLVRLALL